MRPLSRAVPEILESDFSVSFDQANPYEMKEAVELLMSRDGVDVARKKLRALNKHLRKHGRTPVSFEKGHPLFWAAYLNDGHPEDRYEPPPLITPEELRQFREGRGWYVRHLAKRTGYSIQTISNMEAGFNPVTARISWMVRMMMENDSLKEENERLRAELAHRESY